MNFCICIYYSSYEYLVSVFGFSFKILYLLFLLKVADCLNKNFGFKTSDCIEIMQVDRYITWPVQATAYKVRCLVYITKIIKQTKQDFMKSPLFWKIKLWILQGGREENP